MDMITAFLPCRTGSERVRNKNLRRFGPHRGGLLERKLLQLDASERIDRILLSTNDAMVIETALALAIDKPLIIHRREDSLASAATSTDALIIHALELVATGAMLWTHVTAPFVDGKCYDSAIQSWLTERSNGCDSLMSVTPIRSFLWSASGPLNYDRAIERWPRTQTLEPIYSVNSAIFLCPVEVMRARSDRIGVSPFLYELDAVQGMDIDWEEDFLLAEAALALFDEERG